jgi:hypothetical protein
MQNNLKETAQKFNLYQLQDIPKEYINENTEHRIKCGHKEIPEFLTTMQGIEIALFYECKQDTDYKGEVSYYIDYSTILLMSKDSELLMLQSNWKSKKYYLYPYYNIVSKLKNGMNYEIINRKLKEIKEPNLIGVFTENKVKQWIEYTNKYIQCLQELQSNFNDENTKIEEKINDTIKSIKGCKVQKWSNVTEVSTDMFKIIFKHFKDQKYLNTEINFKGSIQDIVNIQNSI